MAKSCNIRFVKMGEARVPYQRVVAALNSTIEIKNEDEALRQGYLEVKEHVSYRLWEQWYKDFGNKKTPAIVPENVTNLETPKAKVLSDLLNLKHYQFTEGSKVVYTVDEETKRIFNEVKRNIMDNKKGLSEKQIDALIKGLKASIAKSTARQNIEVKRRRFNKNIKTKIGAAPELYPLLESLGNIQPSAIPSGVADLYMQILDEFAVKTDVLAPRAAYDLMKDLETVLAVVERENDIPKAPSNADETPQNVYIEQIRTKKVDWKQFKTVEEQELAQELSEITVEDLKGLDNKTLFTLNEVINATNNGYLVPQTVPILIEVRTNRTRKDVSDTVMAANMDGITHSFDKLYGTLKAKLKSGNSSMIGEILRSQSSMFLESTLGMKGRALTNATFDILGTHFDSYKKNASGIDSIYDKVDDLLEKEFKGVNERLAAVYKVKLLELQLMKHSNPDTEGVFTAMEHVAAIKEAFDKNETTSYNEYAISIIDQLVSEYAEKGEFDIRKMKESLTPAEKKLFETNQQMSQDRARRKAFTTGVLQGNRVGSNANSTPVYRLDKRGKDLTVSKMAKQLLGEKIEEVTSKKVPVISLHAAYDGRRGAKDALLQFKMVMPIKQVEATMSKLKEDSKTDGEALQKSIIKAVDLAMVELIEKMIAPSVQEYSKSDEAMKSLVKYGYLAQLASIPRAGAELVSNVSMVAFAAPTEFGEGVKLGFKFLTDISNSDILEAVGSQQATKLYPDGYYTGARVDTSYTGEKNRKRDEAVSEAQAKYNRVEDAIMRNALFKNLKKWSGRSADLMLSGSDIAMVRPVWFGTFAKEFKKASGKEVSWDKLKNKDLDYIQANREAITKARREADKKTVYVGASNNPAITPLKLQKGKGEGLSTQIYKITSNYLMKFMTFESAAFYQGVMGLMRKNELTARQGAGLIVGAMARMSVYYPMYKMLAHYIAAALGWGDEKEEFDFYEEFKKQTVGSALTFAFNRRLTAHPRIPINMFIEFVNKEALVGDKYIGYKDSYVFVPFSLDRLGYMSAPDMIAKLSGPLNTPIKAVSNVFEASKKIARAKTEKKRNKHLYDMLFQATMATLAHRGYNPGVYKDLMRMYQNEKWNKKKKK